MGATTYLNQSQGELPPGSAHMDRKATLPGEDVWRVSPCDTFRNTRCRHSTWLHCRFRKHRSHRLTEFQRPAAPAPRRSSLMTGELPVRPAPVRPYFRFGGRYMRRCAPVVNAYWKWPVHADRSGNALHMGDIIRDIMQPLKWTYIVEKLERKLGEQL